MENIKHVKYLNYKDLQDLKDLKELHVPIVVNSQNMYKQFLEAKFSCLQIVGLDFKATLISKKVPCESEKNFEYYF